MATDLFINAVSGAIASSADYNTNFDLIQNSFADLGPWIVTGLVPSAGVGLAVTVSAGTASIGGRIAASGSFSIAGLANNTTNHLYIKDDGTGVSNTTGTQPADTAKLGTATTSAGSVSSVNVLHSSGRQALIRPENQTPGAVGSMGSLNLASWNATAGDTYQFYGTLPAGAVGRLTIATKTANYTVLTTDAVLLGDASGGAFTFTLPTAVGNTGASFWFKKIDTTGTTITVQGNGVELIDTSNTQLLTVPETVMQVVSNGTQWYLL